MSELGCGDDVTVYLASVDRQGHSTKPFLLPQRRPREDNLRCGYGLYRQIKEEADVIVDRYYYAQLNKQEQAVYKAFYNGLMAHEDVIPIPIKGQLSKEVFNKIFRAMTRDNPLIYYVNQSACNWATDAFGHTAICPQYFYSRETVRKYNRNIENAVNNLAAQLKLTWMNWLE